MHWRANETSFTGRHLATAYLRVGPAPGRADGAPTAGPPPYDLNRVTSTRVFGFGTDESFTANSWPLQLISFGDGVRVPGLHGASCVYQFQQVQIEE